MPLSSNNVVAAVATSAAVAAGLGVASAIARTLRAERPPAESQWREVGRLTELNMFPLKSGKPIAAKSLQATDAGFRDGELRDRVFVAVDRNGRCVTGRSHPRLLHVEVSVVPKSGPRQDAVDDGDDVQFEFRSPGVSGALILDLANLQGTSTRKINVWGSAVSAVDCGDQAAAWIRKAAVEPQTHGEATPAADLRLAFYPLERSDRGPAAPPGVHGIFSDQTSYHVLTTSSLAALNAKLSQPVTARHFRPNLVVDGPMPFEEDDWRWLRIGDQAVFKVVMPCGRCLFTTVDPETGMKSEDGEPLKTLRTFRKPNAEQKKQMGGDSPMLGLRLGINTCGKVSVGDKVYVAP